MQGLCRRVAMVAMAVGLFIGGRPSSGQTPQGASWPRFRGPAGGGVDSSRPLPSRWSETENVLWSAAIPGKGWSAPIVTGNRVFVTTAVAPGDVEPPKTPAAMEDNTVGMKSSKEHRWFVLCLDLRTGRVLWRREAHHAVPNWLIHPKGSHASETPVTDGERVYAYFGNVGLYCYSVDGKPLWSHRVAARKMLFNWGTAIGPEVVDGRVFLVNDSEEGASITCLDARTGRLVWRAPRDEKSNWCNPLVWRNTGRTELVTAGSRGIRSYDLSGKVLWEIHGMSYVTIPSPFVAEGLLWVASGHASGPVRPIYAIRPGASGDISLKPGQKSNAFIAWSDPAAAPYVPTPVVLDGIVYDLTDVSGLAAYRADTGALIYRGKRFGPGGGQFTASPVAGDGKVFCLGEKGDVFVVKAGPEFQLLARNSLPGDTLATPAIADGSLLIRTLTKLYRIGEAAR